jgi:hypothetical protein
VSLRILIDPYEKETALLPGALLLAWNMARSNQRNVGFLVDDTFTPALFAELFPGISSDLNEHGKCELDGVLVEDLARRAESTRFDGVALFVGDRSTSSTLTDELTLAAGVLLMPQSSGAHKVLASRGKPFFRANLALESNGPALSSAQEEGAKWFEANYQVLVEGHLDPAAPKQELGKGEPQICRYCGRAEPTVTFSNVSHALPEQIGNKKLIDLRECDCCNKHFSTLEDSFGKWSLPVRNVGRIKGKKNKIPKYQSADQQMRVVNADGRMNISSRTGDPRVDFDPDGKQLRLSMERQPYIPMAVYKSFVKMALAIMPAALADRFKPYLRWILEPTHSVGPFQPLTLLSQSASGPVPNDKVTYLLLERKEGTDKCPSVVFVVQFSNYIHQIVLPSPPSVEIRGPVDLNVRYFPNPWDTPQWTENYGPVHRWQTDLSSTQVREGDSMPIHLAFDSASQVSPDAEA